jgi:transposase InsO family protein
LLACRKDTYNDERPHQSLGYQTPAAVYRGTKVEKG